jgi:GT2 family glycosyltransferase
MAYPAENSIDVAIASMRLDEEKLLRILRLPKPEGYIIKFYIVSDNPSLEFPGNIVKLSLQRDDIVLLKNEKWMGFTYSKNRCVGEGTCNWVLHLDDDVLVENDLLLQYAEAILKKPGATGFIGLVNLPPSINAFTDALTISGPVHHFKKALYSATSPWGVTANILVNRAKTGDILISETFPKAGGGEEVDYFIRISRRNNRPFDCLPQAVVTHDWWDNGKARFYRMFRYGAGSAELVRRLPENIKYVFPSMADLVFLTLIFSPVLFILYFSVLKIFLLLTGIFLIEWLMTWFRNKFILKYNSPKVAWYCVLLKAASDSGFLLHSLKKWQLVAIFRKFNADYTGDTHYFRTNRWMFIKLGLIASLIALLIIY